MARCRIAILGAGGQARDIAWLLGAQRQEFELVGFIVGDRSRVSKHDSLDLVIGDERWLDEHPTELDALALGIGSPAVRLEVGRALSSKFPGLEWPPLVHPSVVIDERSLSLGKGAMICAGTSGTVNITLEDFALVNVGVTLGHEATVGAGSVVNHGANISGGVVIEESVLVGTGAQVLQYLRVGARATVGAGAVVTHDVQPGAVVVGIPARPIERT